MANCGGYKNSAEWAKKDSGGYLKALKESKNTNVARLINNASPKILKGFMGALGRDIVHPFGWIGGEIIFSAMFSAAEESEGRTPLEALDEGVLWFLPKGVIDAQKKALFGYEGLPTNQRFKTEGYAGAYSQDQINDMKNYLDMEDSDRKYYAAVDKKKLFQTKRFHYESEATEKRVLDKIDAAIKKHRAASSDAVYKIYERNTGLRTDGTPRYEDMYMEDLEAHVNQTGENLWDVQQQYAIDKINQGKQGELNTLYAQKEQSLTDVLGLTKKGKAPYDWMGRKGVRSTALPFYGNPIDLWRASEEFKNPITTPGIKQLVDPIYTLSNIGKVSQEEKEQYAIEQGREDLLHKEYTHPIYGPGFSYEQIKEVYPEYFEYAEGGIAGLSGGKRFGPPPLSGPVPQGEGLFSQFNRVKTLTG